MKHPLFLSFLLTLVCLVGHGQTHHGADSIEIPGRVMELPSMVSRGGDRVGPWGLPTLVALRYGLEVSEECDERLDEQLAQEAAMRYLSDLYQVFGDWDQCMMAYLYSPVYVKNLHHLHRETRRHPRKDRPKVPCVHQRPQELEPSEKRPHP